MYSSFEECRRMPQFKFAFTSKDLKRIITNTICRAAEMRLLPLAMYRQAEKSATRDIFGLVVCSVNSRNI